jgi:hypothetical protein
MAKAAQVVDTMMLRPKGREIGGKRKTRSFPQDTSLREFYIYANDDYSHSATKIPIWQPSLNLTSPFVPTVLSYRVQVVMD